ncbi:MAG: hypothetical protein LBH53_00170 [Puniceicoccales bacterium]|jgi:hypothetical protein|nr:hypothetical protein [Puniceicoccales bacterium]
MTTPFMSGSGLSAARYIPDNLDQEKKTSFSKSYLGIKIGSKEEARALYDNGVLGLWGLIVSTCHFLISNDGFVREVEVKDLARIATTAKDYVKLVKLLKPNEQRRALLLNDGKNPSCGGSCAAAKVIFLAGIASAEPNDNSDESASLASCVREILSIANNVLSPYELNQLLTEDQRIQLPASGDADRITCGNLVSFCASTPAFHADDQKEIWTLICNILNACLGKEVQDFLIRCHGMIQTPNDTEKLKELFGKKVVACSEFRQLFFNGNPFDTEEGRKSFITFAMRHDPEDLKKSLFQEFDKYETGPAILLAQKDGMDMLHFTAVKYGKNSPEYEKMKALFTEFAPAFSADGDRIAKIGGIRWANAIKHAEDL